VEDFFKNKAKISFENEIFFRFFSMQITLCGQEKHCNQPEAIILKPSGTSCLIKILT